MEFIAMFIFLTYCWTPFSITFSWAEVRYLNNKFTLSSSTHIWWCFSCWSNFVAFTTKCTTPMTIAIKSWTCSSSPFITMIVSLETTSTWWVITISSCCGLSNLRINLLRVVLILLWLLLWLLSLLLLVLIILLVSILFSRVLELLYCVWTFLICSKVWRTWNFFEFNYWIVPT